MITIITGAIRAGKTTFAMANVVDPGVMDGYNLYTDIPLRMDAMKERYGAETVAERVHQLPRRDEDGKIYFSKASRLAEIMKVKDSQDRGPIVLIDEAHVVFPSGIKKVYDGKTGLVREDSYYREVEELLALAGHYRAHLVFITQRPTSLFRPIIDLAKESFFVENTVGLGFPSAFRAKVFNVFPTLSIQKLEEVNPKDVPTIGYPTPKPYDPLIQKLFVSQSMSGDVKGSPQALEAKRIRKSIWRNPKLLFFGLLLIPAAWFGFKDGVAVTPKSTVVKPQSKPSAAVATPQHLQQPQANAIDSLDSYRPTQEGADAYRVVIADSRLYSWPNYPGSDYAIDAYDEAGKAVWVKQPLALVASFNRYSIAFDTCMIKLNRADKPVHVLIIPGCAAEQREKEKQVVQRTAAPAPQGSPGLAGPSEPYQDRVVASANREASRDVSVFR